MEDTQKLDFKDLYKHKIDLIQKAIDDTQNTIRFSDTKAAAVIGFWGIISTILIRTADSWTEWIKAFQISTSNSIIFLIALIMIYFLVRSISLAYLVVVPKTNPIKHITIGDNKINDIYFISSLNRSLRGRFLYRISEEIKLKDSLMTYYEKINSLNHESLMQELVLELQKVSFIRTVKVARANAAITSVINFLIMLMMLLLFLVGSEIDLRSTKTMLNLNLNIELLVVLVMGHLIGDYLFQTNKQALRKQNEWVPLLLHCLVYTVTLSFLVYFVLGIYSWPMSFILFVSHVFIDKGDIVSWWAKKIKRISDPEATPSLLAAVDQTFHYLVIFIVCFL